MIKFGFYLLGEKGYKCLSDLIDNIGSSNIKFVCSARDFNIEKDFYDEIKNVCRENSIPFVERLSSSSLKADYIVAIGWRWLIEENHNLIVFHDSLLPKYRGFAPLVNALINGESKVGVTALIGAEKYDSGPIIAQVSMKVVYPIKIKDAIRQMSALYSDLLIEIVVNIMNGKPLTTYVQNDSEVSFSPWRNNDDYFINWRDCAEKISRFVDATGSPYCGAKTKIGIDSVSIGDVKVIDDVVVEDRMSHIGKILFLDDKFPVVICGVGLLKLISIFDENGISLIGKIPFRTRFGN